MQPFIVFILLHFIFFNFAVAEAKVSEQIDQPEKLVWKVNHSGIVQGSGFFIEKNLFVTGFDVVSSLINNGEGHSDLKVLFSKNNLKDITLLQVGKPSFFKVKRVLAVSLTHNLAFLRTEGKVVNPLSIREQSINEFNDSSVPVYFKNGGKSIRRTGRIFYQNENFYTFPVNLSDPQKVIGSPLLDDQGQFFGVVISGEEHLLSVLKVSPLKEFIKGITGFNRFRVISPGIYLKREINSIKDSAERKNHWAQYRLAMMYYRGQGVKKNFEQAFYWINQSLEGLTVNSSQEDKQIYILALYMRAKMLKEGKGTKQNWGLAFKDFQRVSDLGHILALYRLAMMLKEGQGTKQNLRSALRKFHKLGELGYPPALYQKALMHYKGEGTEKNLKLAFDGFSEGAKLGHREALFWKSMMLKEGEGTEKNLKLAFEGFSEGAKLGHLEALFWKSMMLKEGKGTEKDLKLAFDGFREARKRGHLKALFWKSMMLYYGEGTEKKLELAFGGFNEVANQGQEGHREALYMRAIMLYRGEGKEKEKNLKLAFDGFSEAAELGHLEALYMKAKMLKEGEGTEKDLKLAFERFSEAAELGHLEALFWKSMMLKEGEGTEKDLKLAFDGFREARQKGHLKALFWEAKMLKKGLGTTKNVESALKKFRKFKKQDHQKDLYHETLYEEAKIFYEQAKTEEDLKLVFKRFSEAAKLGHTWALFWKSMMLYYGEGTEQNLALAFDGFLHLAKQGNVKAQREVVEMIRKKEGGNPKQMNYWLEQLAEQGDADAKYELAHRYFTGEGGVKNPDQALQFLDELGKKGYPQAFNRLFTFRCLDSVVKGLPDKN